MSRHEPMNSNNFSPLSGAVPRQHLHASTQLHSNVTWQINFLQKKKNGNGEVRLTCSCLPIIYHSGTTAVEDVYSHPQMTKKTQQQIFLEGRLALIQPNCFQQLR